MSVASTNAAPAAAATLYDDLGGAPVVRAVARDAIEAAARRADTADKFKGAELDKIADLLALQLCAISGGGCVYTGRTMAESHEGMGVTAAQFNALIEVLQKAMDRAGVPFRTQNRLLALLAPMYRDIVGR